MSEIIWDDVQPGPAPTPGPAPSPGAAVSILGQWALVLAALAAGGWMLWPRGPAPTPTPGPAAGFVQLGRDLGAQLPREYGAAWREGATLLQAGQGIDRAIGQVKASWDDRRRKLFDLKVSPELGKIVPEPAPGKEPPDPTPDQRAALAKAWRDLADGLDPGGKPAGP